MAKKNDPTKVITGPNTLWSYVSVFEPKSINGDAPKYSIQLRIPETDTVTLKKIADAMKAAYEEGSAKLKGNSKSVPPYETLKKALRWVQPRSMAASGRDLSICCSCGST